VIEINGVPSSCQDILNFIPGTGIEITYSPDCGYVFTATGTMACGSAAYLCTDEVGTKVEVDLSHPTHAGQLLISQPGNASAVWADPQVQGLYPAGSTICPAPAYIAPTCIQPIGIGIQDPSGDLQWLQGSYSGSPASLALNVNVVNPLTVTFSESSICVTQCTSPWVVEDTAAETFLSMIAADLASVISTAGSPAVPVLNISGPIENQLFNGTSWDPNYNNWITTTGDSGVLTAPFLGQTQINYNARGAIITFILGEVMGVGPSFSPQLQYSPDGGTTWFNFGLALSTLSATGASGAFGVYPTLLTPALLGVSQETLIQAALPRVWRVKYSVSGSGGASFDLIGVYVNYLL
jgi:hypothetical protein